MQKMKVAVVGASGVLGRSLVPLLEAKYEVRALVRAPEKARRLFGSQVEVLECDLLAPGIADKLPSLLAGCEVVIHAATAIPTDFEQPGAWDANTRIRTEGTAHLLAAALQAGAQVYLQQSICFAYPEMGDEWITEETPLDQTRTALVEMEQQVRVIPTDRLRWSILRGGTFVGRGTFQDDAIAKLRAGQQKVANDGMNYLPLVRVDDVASAFALAVESAPAGSIFNVADEPLREGDYLDRLAQVVGAAKPPRDMTVLRPLSQRASSRAARAILGWSPTHSLFPQP
jgi:nucleoside-diphosphate-sugar epimerase